MFAQRRFGLRGRAITFCVLLLLGTVGALSAALISQNYAGSLRAMRHHAVEHAWSVSHLAEPAVLLNDSAALERIVQGEEHHDALLLACLVDGQGKVFASFQRLEDFTCEARLDLTDPMGGQPVLTRESTRAEQTASQFLVVAPIWPEQEGLELGIVEGDFDGGGDGEGIAEQPIGYVCLLYSLQPVHAEMAQRLLSSAVVSIVVMVVGIAVTVVMVRQLLNPVRNLVETTTRIAEGDLSRRAAEDAVGEIGVLARAFNDMAGRLQESYESIESTVRERTSELVRANRAKDDFLANVSHEIRTPMTAILGFSENLLDPVCSEEEKLHAIKTIHRNGEHLLSLINDILDVSKIESGRFELERVPCSPIEVLSDVQALMSVRAKAKQLAFGVEYAGPIPETIRTDPTRLRQILINLAGNAVKFTESGSVRVVASMACPPDDPNPQMQFEVIDTGIGIAPDKMERIFKPFTQADESMARRFGGTGLGLAISSGLARLLGGELTARSQPGVGSTFRVTIATGPLEGRVMPQNHGEATAESRACAGESFDPGAAGLGCRVLLAEDRPDNQRLICYMLKKAGAQVTMVENGEMAVDEVLGRERGGGGGAARQPFDVVLMDMQMPVMDGYEATRVLRREGYRGPIIAVTAHAMAGDREKCLSVGCDECVTKPIDRKKLISVICALLQRSGGSVTV